MCKIKICKWIYDIELSNKIIVFLKDYVLEIFVDVLILLNIDEILVIFLILRNGECID